jgi:N-methylhydantoinase B
VDEVGLEILRSRLQAVADAVATDARRERIRRDRLAAAAPAASPAVGPASPDDLDAAPVALFPGVEQRGMTAVASESGAILVHAPSPWTDGCPVIEAPSPPGLSSAPTWTRSAAGP